MYRTSKDDGDFRSILTAVRRIVQRLEGGADDVDDIAQEVMIKLLTSQAVPDAVGNGWLGKVVRGCLVDARRRMASESRYVDRYLYLDPTGAVCDSDDEGRLACFPSVSDRHHEIESDVLSAVSNVVASLASPLRQVLLLWADGMSYEEIAAATDANIGTVRSRLHYARKRARCLLGEIA